MDAEIIAVGSELLTPQKVDTNSLYITDQLNGLGVEVVQKSILGDDRRRLTQAIHSALQRVGLLIVTGGLGPTEDDVTRDAVAQALGRGQVFRQDLCDVIAERFRRMNRPMVEINRRQAYLIEGAQPLPNARGTAPGQWIDAEGAVVILLPGPPRELAQMFEEQCLPALRERLPRQVIRSVCMRVAGMGESEVDQLIAPVYTSYTNPACTILAGPGDIQVHLRARCATESEADLLLTDVGSKIQAVLGDRIYTNTGQTMQERVGELLTQRAATVTVAESCTGGLLAMRLTEVPGSSAYFRGGFLTYDIQAKADLLGIDSALLDAHGPVSAPVAEAMARGARERLPSTYGLSVTGVAGPDGGTEQNPVGTVYIAIADAKTAEAKMFRFPGDRGRVRGFAAQTALDLLRRRLA